MLFESIPHCRQNSTIERNLPFDEPHSRPLRPIEQLFKDIDEDLFKRWKIEIMKIIHADPHLHELYKSIHALSVKMNVSSTISKVESEIELNDRKSFLKGALEQSDQYPEIIFPI